MCFVTVKSSVSSKRKIVVPVLGAWFLPFRLSPRPPERRMRFWFISEKGRVDDSTIRIRHRATVCPGCLFSESLSGKGSAVVLISKRHPPRLAWGERMFNSYGCLPPFPSPAAARSGGGGGGWAAVLLASEAVHPRRKGTGAKPSSLSGKGVMPTLGAPLASTGWSARWPAHSLRGSDTVKCLLQPIVSG